MRAGEVPPGLAVRERRRRPRARVPTAHAAAAQRLVGNSYSRAKAGLNRDPHSRRVAEMFGGLADLGAAAYAAQSLQQQVQRQQLALVFTAHRSL